jgi:hypothetical protein
LACAGVVVVVGVLVVAGVLVVTGVVVWGVVVWGVVAPGVLVTGVVSPGVLVTGVVAPGVVVTGVVATVVVVAALVVVVVTVVAGGVAVVAVVVPAAAAHAPGLLTVSWIKVTSAVWAKSLPDTVMSATRVIWVKARMVPTNVLLGAVKNAELTFQKMLQGLALPMRLIVAPVAKVRSLTARKMKTALGSPCASSVSGLLIRMAEVES